MPYSVYYVKLMLQLNTFKVEEKKLNYSRSGDKHRRYSVITAVQFNTVPYQMVQYNTI